MRQFIIGVIDSDCTPPPTTTFSAPEPICAAAFATAVRLPAQCRLTACPGTDVMPDAEAA